MIFYWSSVLLDIFAWIKAVSRAAITLSGGSEFCLRADLVLRSVRASWSYCALSTRTTQRVPKEKHDYFADKSKYFLSSIGFLTFSEEGEAVIVSTPFNNSLRQPLKSWSFFSCHSRNSFNRNRRSICQHSPHRWFNPNYELQSGQNPPPYNCI